MMLVITVGSPGGLFLVTLLSCEALEARGGIVEIPRYPMLCPKIAMPAAVRTGNQGGCGGG
jgi:hypothetical protein